MQDCREGANPLGRCAHVGLASNFCRAFGSDVTTPIPPFQPTPVRLTRKRLCALRPRVPRSPRPTLSSSAVHCSQPATLAARRDLPSDSVFELQELHRPTHQRREERLETRERRESKRERKRREKLEQLRAADEMKFSHSLQFNAVPDWSSHYIPYSNLKKLYVLARYTPHRSGPER